MNYPENLKKGDTIGICAPSAGIVKPEKIMRLDPAIKQLKELGYKVIETKSVRKGERGHTACRSDRGDFHRGKARNHQNDRDSSGKK